MGIGCHLGIYSSNVIAYADDIVLLAPTSTSLQDMIDVANTEASYLDLKFNPDKSKVMIFGLKNSENTIKRQFHICNQPISQVTNLKYLGYEISSDLCCSGEIITKLRKFYAEFNQILRKFYFADISIKLFLFKQYCLQIYGAELWFGCNKSKKNLKQFAIGYHKAIKKLLNLSTHESNHYACQEAQTLTFENMINNLKLQFMIRMSTSQCCYIKKVDNFLYVSSVLFEEMRELASRKYNIEDLLDNDRDAIRSRIAFVQRHETTMR